MNRNTKNNLTEEALNAKAKKHIMIVLLAGLFMFVSICVTGMNSKSPTLVSGENGLYIMRPASGEPAGHVSLDAIVETDSGTFEKNYDVKISALQRGSKAAEESADPEKDTSEMSREELIGYELRSITGSVNDNTSLQKVSLPDSLSTGEKIKWKQHREHKAAPVAFAVIVLCVLIYMNRHAPLKRLREAQQESITRQLPEFINRLVLLLNAGLVLNTAFEKAVDESDAMSETENDFFYCSMREIRSAVRETNGSMDRAFREFARSRRSAGGDTAQELMRISNIISDNISKGVELTDKLQSESEMLWLGRKRNCEERGRLAETKLTLPLTVFLLVLIVITVSPALLEL